MCSCRFPGAYAPWLLTYVPLGLGIAKEPPEGSPSVLKLPLTMILLAVGAPKQHPISQSGFKTTYLIDLAMIPSIPSIPPSSHQSRHDPVEPAMIPLSPQHYSLQRLLRRPLWPVFLSKSNEIKTEDSGHSSKNPNCTEGEEGTQGTLK